MHRTLFIGFVSIAVTVVGSAARAQTIDPYYAGAYTYADLGTVPGVPPLYGGLTLKYDDPNTLLVGGYANSLSGALYSIGVIRGVGGHIIGFNGVAQHFADAAYNDGGVVYEPTSNVLMLARWPANGLGQIRPGSNVTDKVIDLYPFGVEYSISALNIVPASYFGPHNIKIVTYSGGQWLHATIAPDGMGTFDLTSVTEIPSSRLTGGPEGFVFLPTGIPLFPNPSMLVAEYAAGNIASYELDANANPIVSTRRVFLGGLAGAEGAFIDPLTGDFLFSTFGGGDRIVVVRGFEDACSTCLGDLSADGFVDGDDILGFAICQDRGGTPAGLCRCADLDVDGDIDAVDVATLVDKLLGTQDPDTACP